MDSEPGQGTTVTVYLPRYQSSLAEIKAMEAATHETWRRERSCTETILLVEDEPSVLEMVKQLLEKEGYKVLAAHAPGEAIKRVTAYRGDMHLVITDIIMPEMNGRELWDKIRPFYPHLKCLFMSGYTSETPMNQNMMQDKVHFMKKPFSLQELTQKVRDVLSGE